GGAEVDRALEHLADAAAAADRLVVDLEIRVALVELVEPLRVERVGEGRARAGDERGGVREPRQAEGEQSGEPPASSHSSSSFAAGTRQQSSAGSGQSPGRM